jgi:hypothetical protein
VLDACHCLRPLKEWSTTKSPRLEPLSPGRNQLGHDDLIRLHLNEKAAGKNYRQSALQKRSIADRRAEQALLPYVFEAGGDRALEIIYAEGPSSIAGIR